MPLLAPALTMAELATICASGERTVQKDGRVSPAGQTVTKSTPPRGISVTFTTYAFAVAGMEQTLDCGRFNVRVSLRLRYGGPKVPVRPWKLYSGRVSMTR